jgi:hypothetical protein
MYSIRVRVLGRAKKGIIRCDQPPNQLRFTTMEIKFAQLEALVTTIAT